jgi:hypothetical protein
MLSLACLFFLSVMYAHAAPVYSFLCRTLPNKQIPLEEENGLGSETSLDDAHNLLGGGKYTSFVSSPEPAEVEPFSSSFHEESRRSHKSDLATVKKHTSSKFDQRKIKVKTITALEVLVAMREFKGKLPFSYT